MKIIDRLRQWRDLCDVYGSEFLFMTDGYKQSFVDYLAHGTEFIRNPNDIDKFYFIFL